MEDLKVIVAEHGQQIKTLFEQQSELKALAASTQELALAVKELVGQVKTHEKRISIIEDANRYKARTVWACVATGIIGAALSFVLATVLR